MLYRSLTTGLLAACLLLLARRPVPVVVTVRAPRPVPVLRPPLPHDPVTIVDVAPNIRGEALAKLVRLAPGERVIEINDRPVGDELEAGAAIGSPDGAYMDVSVGAGTHTRRVLLLLH
jgi:hypothetical protein